MIDLQNGEAAGPSLSTWSDDNLTLSRNEYLRLSLLR